jgi:starch synthase
MDVLKLLFVTSELAPFSSTGGLAYVSQSFPWHLRRRGVDARIIVPKYGPQLAQRGLRKVAEFSVRVRGVERNCEVERLEEAGNIIYFVKNDHYFARPTLYNHPDDAERFIFFNECVLRFGQLPVFQPDIFHCNDWLSSPLPYLLKSRYQELATRSKVLLSIRNLRYQGVFPREFCTYLGIDWPELQSAGLDFYGCVNFLLIGILYADMIVTSSASYAKEILQADYDPLSAALKQRSGSLFGIREGIDMEVDNPGSDPRLFANFDENTAAAGKARNKELLQRRLGLPVAPELPLVGWVNRLTSQKGVDLLRLALDTGLLGEKLQLVACADGEPIFEAHFAAMAARHRRNFAYSKYNEQLAYQLYAAADMYLMPSTYEPGGISQLISMRYGAVPIVRETGGLRDTVKAYNFTTGTGTGFTFAFRNAWVMMYTIRRALAAFESRDDWSRIVSNCMRNDCSWTTPIEEYIALFSRLLGCAEEPMTGCDMSRASAGR